VSGTVSHACSFNRGSSSLDCTITAKFTNGCDHTSTVVVTWPSNDDVVDESAFVGRRLMSRQADRTTFARCGPTSVDGAYTYTYDSQKRLVRAVRTSGAASATTTYSNWDAQGRPMTAATVSAPTGATESASYAYQDANRTTVMQTTNNEGSATVSTSFDGDGNMVSQRIVSGATVSNNTTRINATARICK